MLDALDTNPTVLITGSRGFLGHYLVHEMAGSGWRVIGLDAPSTDRPAYSPNSAVAQYHEVELPSPALDDILARSQPDAVIHAAGSASVPRSVAEPHADFRASADVFCSLLNSVRLNVPESRVVFLSSAAVYGNPANIPVDEEEPLHPISPYGFHKLLSEKLAEEFHLVYGLRTCAVRIFSAYGPGLQRQVLWDICRKALSEQGVKLMGTGKETRDFVHGSDVARGIRTVLEHGSFQSEAYNLATGVETTIQDLASKLLNALDVTNSISFDGTVRQGDPMRWQASMTRLSSLGYVPEVDLDQGLMDYAQWVLSRVKISD